MKRFAVLALLVASPTFAQPKPAAEAAYKEGQAKYLAEDYGGAIERFNAAYKIEPDPVYLFNIAQAYRQWKKCREASEYFHRYLDEAHNPPNTEDVKKFIVEMDECAKTQPAEPKPTPSPTPEPVKPVEPLPSPASPHAEGTSHPHRTLGIIVGAAGALLAINGIYFYTKVRDDEDRANGLCVDCPAWTPELDASRKSADSDGHRDEKIMIGSFIAGGAAIGVGVVLMMLSSDSKESPVTIAPTRNGAMASIRF